MIVDFSLTLFYHLVITHVVAVPAAAFAAAVDLRDRGDFRSNMEEPDS